MTYYEKNKKKIIERQLKWQRSKKGKLSHRKANGKYRKTSKGKVVQLKARKKYYLSKKGKLCKQREDFNYRLTKNGQLSRLKASNKHRALINDCLPNLTEDEQTHISRFYDCAKLLSKITGIQHDVDHIIPLSKNGLHHPRNLQILTHEENLYKSAKMVA